MIVVSKRRAMALVLFAAFAVFAAVERGDAPQATAEGTGARIAPLTSWQNVLLGRWVAIDSFVRRYSRRHHIPAQWTMMTFASESVMNPLAP